MRLLRGGQSIKRRAIALAGLAVVMFLFASLALALGAVSVRADESQQEFSFTGRATINGEPAPPGTVIEIAVGDKIIGVGQVSGDDGKWVIHIDAALLQEGVCDAVFYVDGRQADRQWNRCSVDIRLEVDPKVADEPQTEVVSEDPNEQSNDEESEDPDPQAGPEEVAGQEPLEESDDPPAVTTPDEPPTSDHPDQPAQALQPRSPRTGTGGVAGEGTEAGTREGLKAFALAAGVVAIASLAVYRRVRRSQGR